MEAVNSPDYKEAARKLWALLDDIDTLDDACRSDDAAFRKHTRDTQRLRFAILSGEQFDALAASPSTTRQQEVGSARLLTEKEWLWLTDKHIVSKAACEAVQREFARVNGISLIGRAAAPSTPEKPAPTDSRGWWCSVCQTSVPSENCTYEETHDPRAGGCGGKLVPHPSTPEKAGGVSELHRCSAHAAYQHDCQHCVAQNTSEDASPSPIPHPLPAQHNDGGGHG